MLRQGIRREHVFAVCATCALSDAVLILGGVGGIGAATAGILPKDGEAQYELEFWESIKNSTHAEDYEAYLEAYTDGRLAPLARARAERYKSSEPEPAKTPAPRPRARRRATWPTSSPAQAPAPKRPPCRPGRRASSTSTPT